MHLSTRFARLLAFVAVIAACTITPVAPLARAGSDSAKYAIAMVAVSGQSWDAIRYNVRSGESWRIVGDKWVKLADPKPVPEATYEVQMVALVNDWGAVRFDVQSGRTWKVREYAWVEIAE